MRALRALHGQHAQATDEQAHLIVVAVGTVDGEQRIGHWGPCLRSQVSNHCRTAQARRQLGRLLWYETTEALGASHISVERARPVQKDQTNYALRGSALDASG